MLDESELKTKRDALIEQRRVFTEQANAQVAWFDGQVALLEELLKPPVSNGQHAEESIAEITA